MTHDVEYCNVLGCNLIIDMNICVMANDTAYWGNYRLIYYKYADFFFLKSDFYEQIFTYFIDFFSLPFLFIYFIFFLDMYNAGTSDLSIEKCNGKARFQWGL